MNQLWRTRTSLVSILLFVCMSVLTSCGNNGGTQVSDSTSANGNAHTHTFDEWKAVKEASCAEEGEQERTCSCGEKETRPIDATGHAWYVCFDQEGHYTRCTVCNEIGEKTVHTLSEDGFCSGCNQPLSATDGLIYVKSADGTYAEVVGYQGSHKRVAIADEYEGVPVREIAPSAFLFKGMTDIYLPSSITAIGERAFDECSELEAVHISDIASWCRIDFARTAKGDDSFTVLSNPLTYATKLYINGTYSPKLVLTSDVTEVKPCAFWAYRGLIEVDCEEGLEKIGDNAFAHCPNLMLFHLPKSVKSVSPYAFYDSTKVWDFDSDNGVVYIDTCAYTYGPSAAVNLREGTTIIADEAMKAKEALKSITLPDSVRVIGKQAFLNCTSLIEVKGGNGVTVIDDEAFSQCYALSRITIPDGVTRIGDKAFWVCSALTDVTIPGSVKSIGEQAFYNCGALANVTICDGVTEITDSMFEYCNSLKNITIPSSVTSIGEDAFRKCSALTEIHFTGTKEQWNQISKGDGWSSNSAIVGIQCSDGYLNK